MPWREAVGPVRMRRVALAARAESLRDLLVTVAAAGTVDIDRWPSPDDERGEAARRLTALEPTAAVRPLLAREAPDLDELARDRRMDLLAGESEVQRVAAEAVRRGRVAALTGWVPAEALPALAGDLAVVGGAVVPLPTPPGTDPPTLLRERGEVRGEVKAAFAPLVETYATVPYADTDPTLLAGLAYVVMFGMMFGDAGHGLLLVAAGLALRAGRPRRFARYQRVWPFVTAAGVAATGFGVLYGEFFGPTGLLTARWLEPMEEPVRLLVAAIGLGAVLLALAYAVGIVNRWREGGLRRALYAPSGIAGATLFLGLGLVAFGIDGGGPVAVAAGVVVGVVGLALAAVGLYAGAGGGGSGVAQSVVELFDLVIRLFGNLVSFARLAAFGLTHAALGSLVWDGTTTLADRGFGGLIGAVAVLLLGNALAFSLELLVAGIQALRLEYYELFSRVFDLEGRPFRPWRIPVESQEVPS